MRRSLRGLPGRAKRQVADDLGADPYLPFVLVLATVLAGFWVWHLLPNFATRDERDRLFDVLVAYGSVLADPGVESLREGVLWGRTTFAATFYLFGIAVLPVVAVAAVTGQLDAFLVFDSPDPTFGYWAAWHETPAWIWTTSLLLVRLFNVAFAVGSVYLTYRLGVMLRDRTAGRLSALFLTLTFGFLVLAHEGGEDMPALFFLLLAVVLALRYVEAGDDAAYLAGCVAGGVALAFKLTAAPVVLVLGLAYLLRASNAGAAWRRALARPGLLLAGASLGAVTIVLGFPSVLVAGPEPLIERVTEGATSGPDRYYGPDAPAWWWVLRSLLNGLGLPLFVGSVGGVAASVVHLRRRPGNAGGVVVLLAVLGAYLLMLSRWHDMRVHHFLPTFPAFAVLLGTALARFRARRPALARPLIVVLLLTSGAYAVAGDAGYASQPRDAATAWLHENAAANATMEVYARDVQDAAIPHDMTIYHPNAGSDAGSTAGRCPDYIQIGYRDLYNRADTYLRNDPERAAYLGDLLAGEANYEIAAEFGSRPPDFAAKPAVPGSVRDLVRVGIVPQVAQYADEQELGPDQYTVILERTGPCDEFRDLPYSIVGPGAVRFDRP